MQFIKKRNHLIFIICCIISLLPAIYFSFQKDGLFCDEIWTYGIANSTDYYSLDPLSAQNFSQNNSGWVSGKYFSDYLQVNIGEEFDYSSVIKNSKVDSHPALYYYILHTVSSFFPNTFSKWFGLIPNLIIFAIALIYFNKLCLLAFKKPWSYFIPTIWAISAAGINDVIFIRMYMLATLFGIMFTYYFWEFMCKKNYTLRNYLWLGLTICLGMISEFTLLPYFGTIAILYFLFMCYQKKIKKCFSFLLTAIIAILGGFLLYPAFLPSLIGNLLGKQGYLDFSEKIKHQTQNVQIFSGHLNRILFGGYFSIACVFLICLIVACIVKKFWYLKIKTIGEDISLSFSKIQSTLSKNSITIPIEYIACFIIFIAISISFVLITRASNLNDNYGARVIYQLCPLIIFILSYIYSELCKKFKCRKVLASVCVSLALLLSIASVRNFGILWLFKGYNSTIAMSQGDKDKDCIYLYSTSSWNDFYAPANVLKNYNEIYFLPIEDLEQNLDPILNSRNSNDSIVLGFLTSIKDPSNTDKMFNTININNHYNFSFKYRLPYLSSDMAIVFYQLHK